ncbi:hypothetical protein CKAH01_12095 [Colletotrichum kahawae]|uniref:Uncharacterized protein n=1 Tax=Colletotrichum kahawae TaxID=34407 RepID=A0AAD9YSE1_COLKA|nr:hypothetical protein CKAH01_12095 [Colletotrichum kahawae]
MSSKKECDDLIDSLTTIPLFLKRVKALLDHSQQPLDDAIFCSLSRVRAEVEFLDETIERHLSCLGPVTGKPGAVEADVLPRYGPDPGTASMIDVSSNHNLDSATEPRPNEPFLTSGAFAFAKGFDGIVLPINVNAADQMSDYHRNHWILAIVNWKTDTFDAFGMQPAAFSRWSKRIDEYVSELRGAVTQLEKRSHELGPYVDDSCCAFLCTYALERYLGRAPQRQKRWPMGPALRRHYLHRLLNQWQLPASHPTKGSQPSASGNGPRVG